MNDNLKTKNKPKSTQKRYPVNVPNTGNCSNVTLYLSKYELWNLRGRINEILESE